MNGFVKMKLAASWGACAGLALRGLALAMACVVVNHAQAASKEFSIGRAPQWVKAIAPSEAAAPPVEQISEGVYYLLSDSQNRVDAHGRVSFRHLASKALNQSGVESIAHVEIRFDPSYQALTLHSILVRRGAQTISKLDTASVRVLQRERELEYLVYDGSKTANVFLDDIRVGDIVEYAYSLRGTNPVFGNRQFGQFDLQWKVPVHRLHARLLWPAGREIEISHHHTALTPTISEHGGYRDYEWDASDLPALVMDSDVPAWFDPYGSVQWGEFKTWASVAQWAQPFYRTPTSLSPALQAEATRIAQASADPKERMAAALQFVQREIRYLGVEIGAGSYAPSAPKLVLERRFGDCKDKTLLTITLLNALGIQARPALVNTSVRQGIGDLQPTPGAFNHVLVQARLDGNDYWLDPTRAPQMSDLAHLYQPDYGLTLVIDPATRELTPMTGAGGSPQKRSIHAVLDATGGIGKPVSYTVTTVAEGASAESIRNTLSRENREDLQKRYLNFYANYYPGLTQTAPLAVDDDERANRVTVVEHYVIPEFWKHESSKHRQEADIYAPDIQDYLRKPRDSIRVAPLSQAYPVDLTQITEVRLHEPWNLKDKRSAVDDPAFEFERVSSEKNKVLTLTDHFRSRADHIPAADTARYAGNLERARDAVNYLLYVDDNAPALKTAGSMDRFNWIVAFIAILLLLPALWLAHKVYRYDPQPDTGVDHSWQGIGGWLILLAIGTVVNPLRATRDLWAMLPSLATDSWANLTTAGGAAYHALWAPVLLFEMSANLTQLVFSLLLLVLFFQKRSSVPKVYTLFLAASAVLQIIDLWLASLIPAANTAITAKHGIELFRMMLITVIWGSYFFRSRHVKATFIARLPTKLTPAQTRPEEPPHPASGHPAPANTAA